MSSTSTIPRLKPRGGSGSKITATKALTPLSHKPATNPNPSYASGPAHRPDTRPIPRSDGLDSLPKSRPRGRAPSPSDFSRVLSDFRKVRVSDGSTVKGRENGTHSTGEGQTCGRMKESELCVKERNFSGGSNVRGEIGAQFSDKSQVNGQRRRKESGLCDKDRNFGGGGANVIGEIEARLSHKSQINGLRYREESDLCDKDRKFSGGEEEIANESRVLGSSVKGLDVSKGKVVNGRVGSNKNTSKLHEKLAYLEGKVKRIASDIKKTKELLDLNNTDASKLIISDIQEKISGIEKAMGNVIIDSSLRVNNGRGSCSGDNAKVSIKESSDEELGVRLLPHQKLLRDRTLLKVSALVSGCGLNMENSVNPVEEDPIALEFLASLNKVQPDISGMDKNGKLHDVSDEEKETEETNASTVKQGSRNMGENESVEVDLEVNVECCIHV